MVLLKIFFIRNRVKFQKKRFVKIPRYENCDDIYIQIQEFVHKVQNNKYRNYVVEISSRAQNNVVDKLSPYCKQNAITIRPWKGRLPSIEYPRFI